MPVPQVRRNGEKKRREGSDGEKKSILISRLPVSRGGKGGKEPKPQGCLTSRYRLDGLGRVRKKRREKDRSRESAGVRCRDISAAARERNDNGIFRLLMAEEGEGRKKKKRKGCPSSPQQLGVPADVPGKKRRHKTTGRFRHRSLR